MKKISAIISLSMALLITSCETATTTKQAEMDSLNATDTVIVREDSMVSTTTDTTLQSFGDSLKSDLNQAADKIKERSKEFSEAAKGTAQDGIDAIKNSAKKVGDAAKAGADAAKKELKK